MPSTRAPGGCVLSDRSHNGRCADFLHVGADNSAQTLTRPRIQCSSSASGAFTPAALVIGDSERSMCWRGTFHEVNSSGVLHRELSI